MRSDCFLLRVLLCGAMLLAGFFPGRLFAQATDPYIRNGDATKDNCHCYTLTTDNYNLHGSVWNQYKIDLRQPFDFYFNVYLGCRDQDGADGIAFILQPISTSLGTAGGGLGFEGISPSVGVTIDTWQNTELNDPAYDHIAIQSNGVIAHHTGSDLADPVAVLPGDQNIEDCKWHVFRVQWIPDQHLLRAAVDGQWRVSATNDIINTIFKGDPMVYWGFTASTGGARNLQRFCTSLDAAFQYDTTAKQCIGDTLYFKDASMSFGTITHWAWDFGDGTTDSVAQPEPHPYPAAGVYTVKLAVTGNDGCSSDTFRQMITIGTYPVADFRSDPGCTGRPVQLQDVSTNRVGDIDQWYWKIDDTVFTEQHPVVVFNRPGNHAIRLAVATAQGCGSDTVSGVTDIPATPVITTQEPPQYACVGQNLSFKGINTDATIPLRKWYWDFGDGHTDSVPSPFYAYQDDGLFPVQAYAIAENGCVSDSVTDSVHIIAVKAFAGNDTTAAIGQPVQLQASGGLQYQWSPAEGLDDPFSDHPIAVLQRDMTYRMITSVPEGDCADTAFLTIKVYKGPAIYVPTAFSPNGDGMNDLFRAIPAGIASVDYFRVFDRWGRQVFSTRTLSAGWNGTYNGHPQPAGAYVWMISGKDYKGNIISRQGTVLLIR